MATKKDETGTLNEGKVCSRDTKKANIQQSLVIIQTELNAPKNQYNSFGKYKYRSCEDILAAVKPLLEETNCTLTLNDDVIALSDRIYIKATACLTNTEGEQVQTTAFAREATTKTGMDVSQVTGAASSYARKYALNGLFAIDDTKDADQLNTSMEYTQAHTHEAQVKPPKPIDNTKLLNAAKSKAAQVKSRAEFQTWWSRYPSLQQNQEFLAVAQELGKKFPKTV